ncbi:MAG: hypothetical protein HC794_01115 [Nitrospiraceae bacterium]|nr:hypothetical protein [Nitrospiraceae bacterium]
MAQQSKSASPFVGSAMAVLATLEQAQVLPPGAGVVAPLPETCSSAGSPGHPAGTARSGSAAGPAAPRRWLEAGLLETAILAWGGLLARRECIDPPPLSKTRAARRACAPRAGETFSHCVP